MKKKFLGYISYLDYREIEKELKKYA